MMFPMTHSFLLAFVALIVLLVVANVAQAVEMARPVLDAFA